MSGIFRPRQAIARVTRNAGNRRFIAGGRGPNRAGELPEAVPVLTLKQKAILLAAAITPGLPDPPADTRKVPRVLKKGDK